MVKTMISEKGLNFNDLEKEMLLSCDNVTLLIILIKCHYG